MDDIERLQLKRDELDRKLSRAIHERKRLWELNEEKRFAMIGAWYLSTHGLPADIGLDALPTEFSESLSSRQKAVWLKPVDGRRRKRTAVLDEPENESSSEPCSDEYETDDVSSTPPWSEPVEVTPIETPPEPLSRVEVVPPPVMTTHTIIVGTPIKTAPSNTYLHAGLHDREAVKALGARWDDQSKRWYVPIGTDLTPFARWL
jgi:hypothetical protein